MILALGVSAADALACPDAGDVVVGVTRAGDEVSAPRTATRLDLRDRDVATLTADVACLGALTELDLSGNPLATLDLAALPRLMDLRLARTQVTALDLTAAPALEILDVSDTPIATLDPGAAPRLFSLDVSRTGLDPASLALGSTRLLIARLAGLGLEALPELPATLMELDVSANRLTELAPTRLLHLSHLDARGNALHAVDLSGQHDLYFVALD